MSEARDVDEKPKTFHKKCMVVASAAQAKRTEQILGDDWMVIPTGAAVTGVHFSVIVLMSGWDTAMGLERANEWVHSCLSHRLIDKGPILGV